MSTERQAIPRYRAFEGPPLFRQGYRPFFLGAGLWALVDTALWFAVLNGLLSIPTAFVPAAWHAHEMIFGFAAATIAGFLLTAIPNWTGRMPLQGGPLVVLFAIWLIGRAAVATSAIIGPSLAAGLDLAFPVLLIGVVLREILAGRNWRNLPMPAALVGLLVANVLTHLETIGLADTGSIGQRLGIGIIIILISLIGGRIIPSFTRNWLAKRGATSMPATPNGFDRFCLALVVAALGAWVAIPGEMATGALFLAAGFASFARLVRWRGHDTLAEPLVWSLHAGFAWVPAGLCLIGLGILVPSVFPATAGLHALSVGAIGLMTLAVMTRATLGHTGRELEADRWTTAIYILIAAAALVRVAAPFMVDFYGALLLASAFLWSAAFGLFVLRYGRMLIRDHIEKEARKT